MEFKDLRHSEPEYLTPLQVSENKAGRFMSLSMLLHASLVAIVALMNTPPIEFPKNDVVEFEVESDVVATQAIPDGAPVPESKGAPPAPAPAPKEAPPLALPAKAPSTPKAAAPVAAPREEVRASAPAVVSSAPVIASAPVVAAAPDTLDDIQAPDLETSDLGEVAVPVMDDKDLQEDFDRVDNEQHKALVIAKKTIEEDAVQAATAGEEALNELNQKAQAEAQALADAAEARRREDAAAIAAAQASERAAAMAAAAAAAKAAEKQGHGTGDEGEGTGSQGSPAPTKEVAGIPGGVRSLEQLRQMPGNKFPQYAEEERLARQEGEAVFYAYVNKDGSLSQFKLGQSTGYRNLDGKTLAALKKWKFYPGQQGWVEMPFKWTLAGEAREAGGKLRK